MIDAVSMARGRTLASSTSASHPTRVGQVVPQGLGLAPPERR